MSCRHACGTHSFRMLSISRVRCRCPALVRADVLGQNGVRKKAKPQGRGGGTNLQEMSSIHRRSNDTSS